MAAVISAPALIWCNRPAQSPAADARLAMNTQASKVSDAPQAETSLNLFLYIFFSLFRAQHTRTSGKDHFPPLDYP